LNSQRLLKTKPVALLIFATAFFASCSSSPPPWQEEDAFFKPLQRRVKSEPSPSSDREVNALKPEVRPPNDSLYRIQNSLLDLLQETREQRDQIRELRDTMAASKVRFREPNKEFDSSAADSLIHEIKKR